MSGPFKVGDIVICVDQFYRDGPNHGPAFVEGWLRHRAIYRIASAGCFYGVGGVQIEGDPNRLLQPNLWWEADRFRHLPKADEQFIAEMRACKPIRRSVDA